MLFLHWLPIYLYQETFLNELEFYRMAAGDWRWNPLSSRYPSVKNAFLRNCTLDCHHLVLYHRLSALGQLSPVYTEHVAQGVKLKSISRLKYPYSLFGILHFQYNMQSLFKVFARGDSRSKILQRIVLQKFTHFPGFVYFYLLTI